jgi:trans-aconitate methyltransferase
MPKLESSGSPIPPVKLRIRIGNASRKNYLAIGKRVSIKLIKHVGKYAIIENFEHVLDWGCGSGRVARYVRQNVSSARFYGCDIDPDAIAWVQNAFPDLSFTNINPNPPTTYKNSFFDFIYGISVFTHLNEHNQFLWLDELRRITRINGIVAVTVHGGNPTDNPKILESLQSKGFSDIEGDRSIFFSHFLQDDYYRLTKHSKEYVMREWTKYFDILEFFENGIGRQDLVIMKRSH